MYLSLQIDTAALTVAGVNVCNPMQCKKSLIARMLKEKRGKKNRAPEGSYVHINGGSRSAQRDPITHKLDLHNN